jgi:hypothetical protein
MAELKYTRVGKIADIYGRDAPGAGFRASAWGLVGITNYVNKIESRLYWAEQALERIAMDGEFGGPSNVEIAAEALRKIGEQK